MDFSLSEEQSMLADSIARFIDTDYDFETRQKIVAGDRSLSEKMWQTFAELGWTAVPFSEEDGGLGGGPGSFTVTDLPVPGNYTVSITAPGFQTETLSAFFFGGAEQNVGQVVLLPDTSVVRGTVSAGGVGLGEATITLSDGTARTRTTRSASNPAGSYSFAGIAPGSYTVHFEKFGFATKVVSLRVDAGVDATVDTSLVAVP